MSQRILVCGVLLICLIFTAKSSHPPGNCQSHFRIVDDRTEIIIEPGVVNCFSCVLDDNGSTSVNWQIETNGTFVPPLLSPHATKNGTFLVIEMPDDYVQPGTSGRREIFCTANQHNLEARLYSPILAQPLFHDVTVNEGELLELTCVSRNVADISTLQILDPNGVPVSTVLRIFSKFSVANVTRSYTGTYTCVVSNTINNSTVNKTAMVIVKYDDVNTMTALEGGHDYGIKTSLDQIISATVVPLVVLMGLVFTLGLLLIYLITIKTRNIAKSTHEGFEVTNGTENEQVEDSKTTCDTLIYADIGANTTAAVNMLQLQNFTDDSYRVQYADISHCTAPVCDPLPTRAEFEAIVNLDLLVIVLKKEVTERWLEFGLVVGVPKEVLDTYSGCSSDQCLIEMLDYWLRHHPSQLTWKEVAQALKAIKLYQLAEKVLEISTNTDADNDSGPNDCQINIINLDIDHTESSDTTGPELPPKPKAIKLLPTSDTADLLPPPPLPAKSGEL